MSFKDPEIDTALETLMGSCDRETLLEASWKVQELAIEEVAYYPLYYRSMNEGHRNDTFEGWFTQLGGIAGTESPALHPLSETDHRKTHKFTGISTGSIWG